MFQLDFPIFPRVVRKISIKEKNKTIFRHIFYPALNFSLKRAWSAFCVAPNPQRQKHSNNTEYHTEGKVETRNIQPKAHPGDFTAKSAYVAHMATEKKESFYRMHCTHVTGVLGAYLKRVLTLPNAITREAKKELGLF